MSCSTFCRSDVMFAREEAKKRGIKIPKFGGTTKMSSQEYAVFFGDFYFEASACCAFNARQQAIYEYIDEKLREEAKKK